ncbi:MAG: hypothetical protein ACKOFF_08135 [Acidimicrobiales bacterium]
MLRKLVSVTLAAAVASLVSVGAPAVPAGAAAGDGVIAAMAGSCSGIDAKTASWDWTKPSLEMSTDGTTYGAPTGFGVAVCRETGTSPKYWFQILKADGTKELGADATSRTFRVTVPPKSGDNFIYASGYSNMTSFSTSGGSAVVITKPASLSKINFDSFDNFKSRHPECASVTMQNWYTCNIEQSDEDFTATVIQHIAYSTTTLNAMEQNMLGLWVGANVNGFQIAMSCGSSGVSGSAVPAADDGSSVTIGGKTYTRQPDGTYKDTAGNSYTQAQLQALYNSSGGGSSGGGSSSGSYELRITMQGTPHKKRDGSLNKGSMKAFITSAIAKKCFSDGKTTTTLADIAAKLSVTRNATGESASTPTFTVDAVTSPAEGLLISVAEMTFSNPEYTIKSTLSAYLAGAGGSTSGGTASGGTSAGTTTSSAASYKITKKGGRATITIVLVAASTVKIYRKTSSKSVAKLVKSLSGKKGTNTYATTWKSGYVYILRSSKGTQLATLK